MFQQARIKLTGWYLLIIMLISLIFSAVIYTITTRELERGLRRVEQRFRININDQLLPRPRLLFDQLGPELIEDLKLAKKRVVLRLIMINGIILLFSASAGWFLAGKTLTPIAQMVADQRRFVADASHELRTPLTAIKTEIEVALRDKKLALKTAKKLLASNLEEVNKLKSLTDYFLVLSQYQDASSKLTMEKVNLGQAVKEVCQQLQGIANRKNISITTDLKDVDLQANKVSLRQLITILVDNAIKYNRENGQVDLSLGKTGSQLWLRVKDNGLGIRKSDIPHIFKRFYRADLSRTKNVVAGYGLGLAIAKSIVDLHQGKISVQSISGQGSTFTVCLPLKRTKFC